MHTPRDVNLGGVRAATAKLLEVAGTQQQISLTSFDEPCRLPHHSFTFSGCGFIGVATNPIDFPVASSNPWDDRSARHASSAPTFAR
jgi:hypothetical protein